MSCKYLRNFLGLGGLIEFQRYDVLSVIDTVKQKNYNYIP